MQIVKLLVGIVLAIVALGLTIPALWPLIGDSSTDIAAMSTAIPGAPIIQSIWPVVPVIGAIALGIGLLMFIISKTRS
jgi:hypothetical protein